MKNVFWILIIAFFAGLIGRQRGDNAIDTLSAGFGCIFKLIFIIISVVIILFLISD